jgi:4-amino-4-deoxy-L-arabinose transferase-like glycosyltransferase
MRYLPLLLLLLAYLLVGSLYASFTPPWQAPDEPAHYNYVRQVADGRLPVIEPGDYDQAYQGEVISSRFDPRYSVEPFEYEDWQPPLYYLLLAPLFNLTKGELLPLRLASVALGAVVVALAYGIAWWVFDGRDWLALAAAAFVAFVPQHMAMMAAVNNDGLAEVVIGGILLLLIRGKNPKSQIPNPKSQNLQSPNPLFLDPASSYSIPNLILIGILLGLGFLTKATVLVMVPVVGLALLRWYWGDWRGLTRAAVLLFGTAVLLGTLWWGRNMVVYGGLDVLGKAAHDAVVVGQPRTADWLADYGVRYTLRALVVTTYNSFWGQFGWMAVPMQPWVYNLLLLFCGLTLLGYLGFGIWDLGVSRRRDLGFGSWDLRFSTVLLLATLGFTLLLYLGYNLTFVQHQGRYLFPALIPIGIGVAAGWEWLMRPLSGWRPALGWLLPLGLALGLVGLDLLALFRFIVPNL